MVTPEQIQLYAQTGGLDALQDPQAFIDLAEERLIMLLCRESAGDGELWASLVAYYVKALLDLNKLDEGVRSKSVRNFSISFNDPQGFRQFNLANADLLAHFSECPVSVSYQTDLKHREQGDRPDEPYGGIL